MTFPSLPIVAMTWLGTIWRCSRPGVAYLERRVWLLCLV